jgi:hypothetical protein
MRTRQEKNHKPAIIWLLPQYASCVVSSLVIARMVYGGIDGIVLQVGRVLVRIRSEVADLM